MAKPNANHASRVIIPADDVKGLINVLMTRTNPMQKGLMECLKGSRDPNSLRVRDEEGKSGVVVRY